jgi:hypothetical protein
MDFIVSYIQAGTQQVMGSQMMIGFIEKTWFVWWFFANLLLLRWFHVAHWSETIEPELDLKETAGKSATAA